MTEYSLINKRRTIVFSKIRADKGREIRDCPDNSF